MSIKDIFNDEIVIGYYIYETIYFAGGLIYEDQYTNAYFNLRIKKNFNIRKSYNYTLEDRIKLMSYSQLIKIILVLFGIFIYGIVLYFGYLYSNMNESIIQLNLKNFFHIIITIFMIIFADIIPFLFIFLLFLTILHIYVCLIIGILVNI